MCRKLSGVPYCYLTLVVARPANASRSTEGAAMARSPPVRVHRMTYGPARRTRARQQTRRRQHMRLYVVAPGLGAVIVAGVLTSSADASLCLTRSGKMRDRDTCKPKETEIDMSGKSGPMGPAGAPGAAGAGGAPGGGGGGRPAPG